VLASNITINETQSISNLTEEEQKKIEEQKLLEEERKKQEEDEKLAEEEERKRLEEQKRVEEEAKKKLEEERIKKEQEEAKLKEEQEQQRKKEEEEKQRVIDEQRKAEEERKQKIFEHTNIRIEAHLVSTFGTVLELAIRYISILVIIYIVADNPTAPKVIALICILYSNPLMFLQLSYPNQISNALDMFSQSAPFLYLSLWLYYIHANMKYTSKNEHDMFLGIKLLFGFSLYIINSLRLLHYNVLGW
jgi:cation transport ATPase